MPASPFLLAFLLFGQDQAHSPEKALAGMTLPEGFAATVFASEPMIAQPIAMTTDAKGRVWVIENHSYPHWITDGKPGRDKVSILEDTDGDGRADKKTVFLDNATNLSGIALGQGGVWLAATPNLLLVPDVNGDDQPDGPPVVKLNGFDLKAKHNVVNSLRFAPDGWLWGCNGILGNASIGSPGTPENKRVKMNCGVWRYHPTQGRFEVVAHGTTNPWGLDFDGYGEAFITNCVIAHLWHVVPGGRYQRMFGNDPNPASYQLMDTVADHLHWGGGHWTSSRGGTGVHSVAGGGHAHAGLAIVRHPDWPDQWNGSALMANIHGMRLNADKLTPNLSTYTASHLPDPVLWKDPWFRGLIVNQGPDGAILVADWSDTGECHNYDKADGVTGRIYRIAPRGIRTAKGVRPADLKDMELLPYLASGDAWMEEQVRLALRDRLDAQFLDPAVREKLAETALKGAQPRERYTALWALANLGAVPVEVLAGLVNDPDETVRGWAARLGLGEGRADPRVLRAWISRVQKGEISPRVRLALASAAGQLDNRDRMELLFPLTEKFRDGWDPMIPWMLWYRLEPVVRDAGAREKLLAKATLGQVVWATAELAAETPEGETWLANYISNRVNPKQDYLLVQGWLGGKNNLMQPKPPEGWAKAYAVLAKNNLLYTRLQAMRLAQVFGTPDVSADLRAIVDNQETPAKERREALEAWVVRPRGDLGFLFDYLKTPELATAAIQGLAGGKDTRLADQLISQLSNLREDGRQAALAALVSRASWANQLAQAVEQGKVPAKSIPSHLARQVGNLKDGALTSRWEKAWGSIQPIRADKKQLLAQWKEKLTPETLGKGEAGKGKAVFARSCAGCHQMFGEGGKLGPNLTGGQRGEVLYWLENLVDPSAVVGREHQRTILELKDGRVLVGVIREENAQSIQIAWAEGEATVSVTGIETRTATGQSIMPDGLLESLNPTEVQDLFAYLMSRLDGAGKPGGK